jgi:hypothetical protein
MSRPRASRPRVYAHAFRVRILLDSPLAPPDAESIWREVELRGNQNLVDLAEAILNAFGFDNDHLWSFFLSGRAWDSSTEYTYMPEDRGRPAERLRVRDAPAGREFLFLFDYGDEWRFGVRLARTGELEPGAAYPRVVASHGAAPEQYPRFDEDDEWDEDEDDELEEAFQEERDRLVERFEAWAEQRGAAEDTWMAPTMLEFIWEESEGSLTLWTADDLRELLLEWCPALMVLEDEKIPKVVPSVRAFMRFLADNGLLDPESDRHSLLDATLDWIASQFEEEMRDPSRHSSLQAAIPGLEASPSFPPVALPEMEVLQAGAAAAAPMLRRLVRVEREKLPDDPLELFNRAFDALPELGAELLPGGVLESAYMNGLAGAIGDLLSLLYAAEEPVQVGDLAAHVWEEHLPGGLETTGPLAEVRRTALADEVARLLTHLQEMGMVEGIGGGRGGLRLTPLGVWRTNALLRAAGCDAPAIGDLTDKPVQALLEGVAAYDDEARQAELRAWCRARSEDAAGELAAYARSASGFEWRMAAFAALEEAGPAAEAQVRVLLDDPELRPMAQMWLVRKGLADQRSLDPDTTAKLMASTLIMFLEADGPSALIESLEGLGPAEEQIAMLADLWRVPDPRVGDVLDMAGKAHPDPKVAKAARKTALKFRSAGR